MWLFQVREENNKTKISLALIHISGRYKQKKNTLNLRLLQSNGYSKKIKQIKELGDR